MRKLKKVLFKDEFYSKWIVLFLDGAFLELSVSATLMMIPLQVQPFVTNLLLMGYLVLMLTILFALRIHVSIVRYANLLDLQMIVFALFLGNATFAILLNRFSLLSLHVAVNFTLTNFILSSSILIAIRLLIKALFRVVSLKNAHEQKVPVLIFGTDQTSLFIKRAVENVNNQHIVVKGFVEYNNGNVHKRLHQKNVIPISNLQSVVLKHKVSRLYISNEQLKHQYGRDAVEKCVNTGVKIVKVPEPSEWINDENLSGKFKDLKIDDILERDPIELNIDCIQKELTGKRILVTGAAGSIGSEIVRQVLTLKPELVILFDQAETPLHDLKLELEESGSSENIKILVGDIQNFSTVKHLFASYKPEIIFHAAAYKHVPMMEENPTEAILTNVLGTKNLADCSLLYNAEKFIMISTDKAVRPTNIMGASKRIAEMYVQAANRSIREHQIHETEKQIKTRFVTTRFGNVLGSNGSVIPRFRSQIKNGGPVTVTHPDVTRYFMTVREAVQLVLEASVMGRGGEIFLFEMGKPVRITDLAINMIKLAGYSPGDDIKIAFTGLRQGEKLYEELLGSEEETVPTYHKDIRISKSVFQNFDKLLLDIETLLDPESLANTMRLVSLMKKIVPEFVSNNSQFCVLDSQDVCDNIQSQKELNKLAD